MRRWELIPLAKREGFPSVPYSISRGGYFGENERKMRCNQMGAD
jgi:hypothetical protein